MKYRFLDKSGLLTGKYKGMTEPPPGTRHFHRTQVDGPRFWNARGFRIADILEQAALESSIPMARRAIGWPLGRKFVSAVIIGVKSVEQLKTNLENADGDLPADIGKTLEERTRPEEDYLSWFNRRNSERLLAAVEFRDERAEPL